MADPNNPLGLPRFTPVLQLAEVAMRYEAAGGFVRLTDVAHALAARRRQIEALRVDADETGAAGDVGFNAALDAVLALELPAGAGTCATCRFARSHAPGTEVVCQEPTSFVYTERVPAHHQSDWGCTRHQPAGLT